MIALYLSTIRYAPDSFLIRFNTRCQYSHIGFVNTTPENTIYLSSHLQGGVKIRTPQEEHMSDHLYVTAPKIEQAYEWALTQVGKPYDYTAIFGLALDRNWRKTDSWFCSELVSAAFEYAGSTLLNPLIEVWRVTPRDILLSNKIVMASLTGTLGMTRLSASRRYQENPSTNMPPAPAHW